MTVISEYFLTSGIFMLIRPVTFVTHIFQKYNEFIAFFRAINYQIYSIYSFMPY